MAVTLEDVAVRAKLNKGSVSRILNGKGAGYSEQTRQRVFQVAAEMGYQPNALSRALWTGQTHTIALWTVTEQHYSPYFGYMQFCAQRLIDQHGYKMITETVALGAIQPSQQAQDVYWPVDGVMSCYLTRSATAYLHSVVQRRCPIVALQSSHRRLEEDYPDTDYVFVDLYSGAKQAVEHLLQAGCQRIAFVAQPHMFTSDPRGQLYSELLGEAGKATEFVAAAADTRACGYEAIKAYIERNGCPDGIFCANDELALGCDVALRERGIQIPGDVLLVGFDGLENARFLPCPISSVVVPIEEMCALGWEMLSQRIKNPEAPVQQKTLSSRLEIRASSTR